jgi:xanthine dehydrogenase YagR molybdenum-binding subunit
MKVNGTAIGKPASRVDGRLKVTGEARYAAEESLPGMAHGVLTGSPIAHGRIVRIDTSGALKLPGVLAIYTHENRGRLGEPPNDLMKGLIAESRLPLEDDEIHYAGQYVAMVVAETFEQARDAAARVKVRYEREEHAMTIEDATESYSPSSSWPKSSNWRGEMLRRRSRKRRSRSMRRTIRPASIRMRWNRMPRSLTGRTER